MHLIRSQFSDQALKLANLGNAQKCESTLAKGCSQGKGISAPSPLVMTSSIVAPHVGGAQHSCNSSAANVLERRRTLEALPEIWRDALLAYDGQKRPVCPDTGYLLRHWPDAQAPSFDQLLGAQAVGLRTGPISSTIAFDFDGIKSWKTFRRLFGGEPWHVLPDSLQWTSGRDARRQVAFFVAPEHHHLLGSKRRKIDDLEFRWENAASVICGKHPLTTGYKWLEGYAPWEIELATLPLELIEKIPNCREAPERLITNYQPIVYDLVVPLDAFITYASSVLIRNGSNEGCCNDDALRLSMDLVAAENWLKVQGVGVDISAQALFDQYVDACPDRVNGKPLDRKAMQARFDGALRRIHQRLHQNSNLSNALNFRNVKRQGGQRNDCYTKQKAK
jgi:hypothetical protein